MKDAGISRKVDVIIVVGGTLFLLMNIVALGSGGRRQAKAMVCLANLHQWGRMFELFTNDNNGQFSGAGNLGWKRGAWILGFRPMMETRTKLLCCPEASVRHRYAWGGPFNTYVMGGGGFQDRREEASYGANSWLYNAPPGSSIQGRPTEWNWRSVVVQGADNIPVFADSMYRGGGPYESGIRGDPPQYNGQWRGYTNEMMHFCIDRHNGAINVLLMDWSARKIGLKQLWTLKWHRQFNTAGPWTIAGGARPGDWPQWMENFRDY
ncbi:MAG: hypothetical protein ACYTE3_12710 [Planctomycetota bacterium]